VTGSDLPVCVWQEGKLRLPTCIVDGHRAILDANGWHGAYSPTAEASESIGGASPAEAETHFINRFLNSVARVEFVCADPLDVHSDIREMVLDQLGEGSLFILDIAAGHGAGTLAILALISELRREGRVPKLPLNVYIHGVDYSPAALINYQAMLAKVEPALEAQGIQVELTSAICDLRIAGEFSDELDSFFAEAQKRMTNRFFCLVSAISGLGKEGMEDIHDSLKMAAARLGSKSRSSSWLWIEPRVKAGWIGKFGATISLTLQKIKYRFTKKGDSYEIATAIPSLPNPQPQEFSWSDPYTEATVVSRVIVMAFRKA
jgi:hypothetical protein